MPFLHNRGNPQSRIWIIVDAPYPSDVAHGFVFSGGMGFVFEKMLKDAGLDINECFVCSRRPNTDERFTYASIETDLLHYRPPFILALGESAQHLSPELRPTHAQSDYRSQLQKYAGSLLQSPLLNYPHYVMPVYGPDRAVIDWAERNITAFVDLQKMRDELEYWKKYGTIQPLRTRELKYGNLEIGEICKCFERFRKAQFLSVDIETVYPRKGSAYLPHPGYPITVGIADSSDYGISFNLFRELPHENTILWRELDSVFSNSSIIGQNFFNFDALFLESLGFTLKLDKVQDTLLRHHILWPELSHKLQFLTRQYTREPYYKDEGKHWSMKDMNSLRRYNCLDVTVTYEVFLAQEEEFKTRPHLKGVAA